MKRVFKNIFRFIVGTEYGFTGEGNEQWYYTLSIAINLMLIWWLKPEIGLTFTILSAVHYLTIILFSLNDWLEYGAKYSYLYFGIHLILLIVALFTNIKWTIVTVAITLISYFIAPDCTANNIFLRKSNSKWALLFNTIIFFAYIAVVFLLPIQLWIKIIFVVGALLIHPLIDFLEGDYIYISDVTLDAIYNIQKSLNNKNNKV